MATRSLWLRSLAVWLSFVGSAVVVPVGRADDHMVAVIVRVAPALKLDDSDLSRIGRGQLPRYDGGYRP
jgi:hypothetical protein